MYVFAFDGWSELDRPYVAIAASVQAQSGCSVETHLLGFSYFQVELSQDAHHHKSFCEDFLRQFGKRISTVIAFLGDNHATNRTFARKAGLPV